MKIKKLLFAILMICSLMVFVASAVPNDGNIVENKTLLPVKNKIVQDTLTISTNSPDISKGECKDNNKILLINAEIDTLGKNNEFSTSALEAKNDAIGYYYIIQFKGRITNEWRRSLEDTGAEIIGYVPSNAYLVRMEPSVRYEVELIDEVQWIGNYKPEYKVSPELSESTENVEDIIVVLFNSEDNAEVSADIEALGGEIIDNSGDVIQVVIDPLRIPDIAALDEVKWIEKHVQPVFCNDVARDITGVSYVSDTYGLTGKGQIIGIMDTGLDTGINDDSMHDDLEGRIIKIFDLVGDGAADMNGHGTHVAGSVLGNGNASGGQYKGMAPEAELIFQAVQEYDYPALGTFEDLTPIFQQAYDEGVRIHTNSWGGNAYGRYTIKSYYTDKFMWEYPDMLILFAAGNAGKDSNSDGVIDPDSIDSPATAKNCISVGASENYKPETNWFYSRWGSWYPINPIFEDNTADNIEGIAAFSSRGPTDDGRIKPDIVAPGTFIASTRSSRASGTAWMEIDENYLYMGGTSMATPITAGAAALVRQNYVDNLNITPSAALIKATIINGAHDMTPGQYGTGLTQEIQKKPDYSQGWGRLDVNASLYPSGERSIHFSDGLKLGTGEGFEEDYYIANSSEPLRVTLVWTDYPAEPNAAFTLVNDLDLYVIGPDRRTYKEIDGINNVEQIEILEPEEGIYRVMVNGFNVPQGPQPFSLVLSGATDELPELQVIDFAPEYPMIGTGSKTTFCAHTMDQYSSEINANVKWSSDNTTVGSINEDTGEFTAKSVGTTNITAHEGNLSATSKITILESISSDTVFAYDDEIVEVRSPIYRGNNISEITISANHDEFPFFHYDLDDGFGTERIYVNSNVTDPRTINESGLVYYTKIKDHEHAYTDWSTFRSIGLFGEAYVPISSNPAKLSRLLFNDDVIYNIENNGTIELLDGYAIDIIEIDTDGNKAYISLTRDGNIIDSSIVSSNSDYVYEMDLGSIEDVPVVRVHFNDILMDNGTYFVSANGVFQIADDVLELNVNDTFGQLQVVEIENDHLKLSNIDTIILESGTIINITDDIKINVLDHSDIRFYFMKNFTDIGSYQLRGTVANSSAISIHEWNGSSFSGFDYDTQFDLWTENLEINTNESDDRMIATDNLAYTSFIEPGSYKYNPWNWHSSEYYGYFHMGLFGKEYAVRKNNGWFPILFPDKLYEVILNNDEKYVLRAGQKLDLGKGYELKPKIIDSEGKKVLLEFLKDGKVIDEELIEQGGTWTYISEVDGFSNIEVLKVHVSKVCQIDTVEIEGIWLMSDEVAKEINIGDEFGELYVDDITEQSIVFKNKNSISLDPGSVVDIAEGVKISVADSPDTDVRFYPFVTHTISNEPRTIEITPATIDLIEGDTYNFNAQALDKKGNELNVTMNWSSSNTTVGTIEETTGRFTALDAGNTIITATSYDVNGTASINVTQRAATATSHTIKSSSSGGGGGGTSGEKYENIEKKEAKQQTVNKGSEVTYEFNEEKNAIENIKFTALRNSGKITTTVEVLKERSSLVDSDPSGTAYKHMNIFVGKAGFANEQNIADTVIGFSVNRSWINANDINESTIVLNRHHDGKWNPLNTTKTGEDNESLHFESETPGFSPFAITGYTEEEMAVQEASRKADSGQSNATSDTDENNDQSADEGKNTPGFSFGFVAMLLFCAALVLRKRS